MSKSPHISFRKPHIENTDIQHETSNNPQNATFIQIQALLRLIRYVDDIFVMVRRLSLFSSKISTTFITIHHKTRVNNSLSFINVLVTRSSNSATWQLENEKFYLVETSSNRRYQYSEIYIYIHCQILYYCWGHSITLVFQSHRPKLFILYLKVDIRYLFPITEIDFVFHFFERLLKLFVWFLYQLVLVLSVGSFVHD